MTFMGQSTMLENGGFQSPEFAGAAGALIYILIGGFKGAWWHRLAAFGLGFAASVFLAPMIVDLLGWKSPNAASGMAFLVGALALLAYAKVAKASISFKFAGLTMESKP